MAEEKKNAAEVQEDTEKEISENAEVLIEALPYIQRFKDRK